MACASSREDRSGLCIDSEASGERIQDLARGEEHVREHPRAQPRPGRPGLAEYFTPNACEGRALRNEAICEDWGQIFTVSVLAHDGFPSPVPFPWLE